jgi:hypothetical protein
MVQPVGFRYAGDRQVLEGVDRLFQVPSRQVQIDAGGFQIGMPHQDLDGWQIGAILQQMSGKTMSQGLLILLMICSQQEFAIDVIRSMA